MSIAQQRSHRQMPRSSFWGTLCCPVVHASSTSLPPCSHHGVGSYIIAHERICGRVKPDTRVLVQPPSQGRLKLCAQSSSQLYPHEIFLERKLHNLSRQSDLNPCGNLFELPIKSSPRATAGNKRWTTLSIGLSLKEATSVFPTIILEVSSSGHVGQEYIFSVEILLPGCHPVEPGQIVWWLRIPAAISGCSIQ